MRDSDLLGSVNLDNLVAGFPLDDLTVRQISAEIQELRAVRASGQTWIRRLAEAILPHSVTTGAVVFEVAVAPTGDFEERVLETLVQTATAARENNAEWFARIGAAIDVELASRAAAVEEIRQRKLAELTAGPELLAWRNWAIEATVNPEYPDGVGPDLRTPAQLREAIGLAAAALDREVSAAKRELEAANHRIGEVVAERAYIRNRLDGLLNPQHGSVSIVPPEREAVDVRCRKHGIEPDVDLRGAVWMALEKLEQAQAEVGVLRGEAVKRQRTVDRQGLELGRLRKQLGVAHSQQESLERELDRSKDPAGVVLHLRPVRPSGVEVLPGSDPAVCAELGIAHPSDLEGYLPCPTHGIHSFPSKPCYLCGWAPNFGHADSDGPKRVVSGPEYLDSMRERGLAPMLDGSVKSITIAEPIPLIEDHTPLWTRSSEVIDPEPAIRCYPEVGCIFVGPEGPVLTIDQYPDDGAQVLVHDVVRWWEKHRARTMAASHELANGFAKAGWDVLMQRPTALDDKAVQAHLCTLGSTKAACGRSCADGGSWSSVNASLSLGYLGVELALCDSCCAVARGPEGGTP